MMIQGEKDRYEIAKAMLPRRLLKELSQYEERSREIRVFLETAPEITADQFQEIITGCSVSLELIDMWNYLQKQIEDADKRSL